MTRVPPADRAPGPASGSGRPRYERSAEHLARARRVLTRGVASAMREAQRPTPLAIESAAGSRQFDEDGNAYIDYVLGFGPMLLGHRPPEVMRAVEEQLGRGVLFGAQHRGEAELAARLIELVPSAELVALSNSGSEAVQAAQERYGVEPHLTVLAKAIASGFPLSAVTGSAEIMSVADTAGPVRHIGTYNGNPVSVAAANATLELLAEGGDELYARLESRSARLADGLREAARALGAPLVVNQVGAVLHLLWDPRLPVRTYEDAYRSDAAAVADLAANLLGSGIFATERGLWFVSTAHSEEDVDRTVAASESTIAATLAMRD